MKINIERLRKIENENNRLKGITSIILNDSLVVENIKIISGDKGYFIAMPTRKRNDGTFKEIAHPTVAKMNADITKAVLDAFNYGTYNQGKIEEFHVTDVKVGIINSPKGNLRAIASVLLNDEFVIHEIKIVEENIDDKKTNKIYMPMWNDGEVWKNLVYAIDKKLVEEIINKVYDEYKNNIQKNK